MSAVIIMLPGCRGGAGHWNPRLFRVAIIAIAALSLRLASASPLLPLQPSAHTISVVNGQLHYVTLGSAGIPLIVINGGPGFDHHVMMPTPTWARLARFCEVVFYDQRGTGESTSNLPVRRIDLSVLTGDLDALRRALRSDKVDVLGWSWGGYLAMAYAARYPRQVAHLVLVDSAPPALADNLYLFKDVFPDVIARERPNHTLAGKVGCESERISDYLYMEFYDPDKRSTFLKSGPFSFSEGMCTATMLYALKHDLTGAVRTLPVRTLVISGRFDANVAPIVSMRISRLIPRAQFKIIERSGHMPFIEQPKEFGSAVQSFLGDAPDAGSQGATGAP